MTRIGRVAAWTTGLLAGLLVLLVVAVLFFPWNRAREPLAEFLGGRMGRDLRLAGDLDVDLGWTTRLTLRDVTLSNADWGSEPTMFEARRIDLAIRIPELLRGRMVLPQVVLDSPKLLLERNRGGEGNWQFESAGATAARIAAPEERTEVPIIERLVIREGRVAYRDPKQDIDIDSRINTAVGEAAVDDLLQLAGTGTFAGKPFRLQLEGGSLLTLRDADHPYPLRLDARIGETRGRAEGTVTEPLSMTGLDLRLDLSGPDMAQLFPIFGIPIPETPPYRIAGRLAHEEDIWTMTGLDGRVGRSDLGGDLTVELGGKRPKLTAKLVSDRLDMKDLAGFIGGRPGEKDPTKAPDRVLPSTPVNVERLRVMDMDVSFNGRRIESRSLPLDQFKARLVIDGGRARLQPVSFGVASGQVAGTVAIDATGRLPRMELDLRVQRLRLSDFFQNSRLAEEMAGTIGGHIELAGSGASTADILAVADGRVTLFMGQGRISNLVMELAGIDLAESLGIALTRDRPVGLRCAIADFGLQDGVLRSRTLVVDTTDTIVTGDGTINLGSEDMALELLAHPKDPSPLSARTPITVQGTLKRPQVGVDPSGAVARAGVAVALGALLTPLAALLPFIEVGLGQDSPCASMIQQAQADEPGTAR